MLGFPALRWHPFFCARRVLVGADDRAVQQQPFQIGILQLAENAFPNSFGRPAIKTFPDRGPLANSTWNGTWNRGGHNNWGGYGYNHYGYGHNRYHNGFDG